MHECNLFIFGGQLMKKTIKFICFLLTISILSTTIIVMAQNNDTPITIKSKIGLEEFSKSNNVNIMLYDENNHIINEFHTDGNVVNYEYSNGKLKKSIDTLGFTQEYSDSDNEIVIKEYKDNKLLVEKKTAKMPEDIAKLNKSEKQAIIDKKLEQIKEKKQNSVDSTGSSLISSTSYEDYYVNGVLMNDIAISSPNHDSDYFCQPAAMTEQEIQNFFVSKNSILKDPIQIWRKKSDGTVYNTGTTIKPSTAIYNAQQSSYTNAKVIIATLQKESSLVGSAPGSVSYSSRRFYYAMGYGATDGGDINGTSGFDIQISKGAECLIDHWMAAPYDMTGGVKLTVNNGIDKTSNGITYKGYIYVLNWGTYALYKYTPWTIDTAYLPSFTGGNYLFYQIFKGYWGTDWT